LAHHGPNECWCALAQPAREVLMLLGPPGPNSAD
jgi:hypothetical protein